MTGPGKSLAFTFTVREKWQGLKPKGERARLNVPVGPETVNVGAGFSVTWLWFAGGLMVWKPVPMAQFIAATRPTSPIILAPDSAARPGQPSNGIILERPRG
jgi:hypothetical protein